MDDEYKSFQGMKRGRSSFARCFIEVKADEVLKDSITMGIPLPEGMGFSKETVRVEYEWKPPRCEQCKIFGHVYDQCPKNATAIPTVDMTNDGFQTVVNKRKQKVVNRRKNGKTGSTNTNRSGVNVGKATWQPIKPKVRFEPKAAGNTIKNGAPNVSTYSKDGPNKEQTISKKQPSKTVDMPSSSKTSYTAIIEVLMFLLARLISPLQTHMHHCLIRRITQGVRVDMESEEEVKVVYDEYVNVLNSTKTWASTYTAHDVFKT
ncbi:putative ribonuclease H-like domain-containing protein [Tanacetum coccineum]